MVDHVFGDAIAALRDVLEQALLEPQVAEERLHVDVLGGDVTWQTSYSLPGEGDPPRVQADLTLEWSTWSQASYRSWRLGDSPSDPPRIALEVCFRLQRLATLPGLDAVEPALPPRVVTLGDTELERTGQRLETSYEAELAEAEHAVESTYQGHFELEESVLDDTTGLDTRFAELGVWITSTLVRLTDLQLDFLPPDEEEATS